MTLLCYVGDNVPTGETPPIGFKNYRTGSTTIDTISGIIRTDPLSTEPNFAMGGNRLHYGSGLETTVNGVVSWFSSDLTHNRLPMCSIQTSNSYATVGAAAVGSTIWNQLLARGTEIRDWQNLHRGQGKWGSTFCFTLNHEVFSKVNATDWLAAMKTVINAWKTAGVIMWDGDGDTLATTTEGLIAGCCLIAEHPTAYPGHLNDIDSYMPPNDTWVTDNLFLYAPDAYNGSGAARYYPPSSLYTNLRNKARSRKANSALRGKPFVTIIYEMACAELEHFTNGAGSTVTSSGVTYPGWTAVYGSTPYSKQFWMSEAGAWFRDNWPDLAALVYWDDNAASSPGGIGATNCLDSSPEAWDSFITNWVDNTTFQNASDPVPTGAPPAPPPQSVAQPTLLQSTAIINSSTPAAVYNSAPFNVGPGELVLLWTEAESGTINPGVPSMSFPTAPTAGTAPTFTRIAAGDYPWASVAVGGVNAAQGLWVASTASSGAASGCVLRVTYPASVGGCTVVMERILGANIAGAASAAIVGAPVKSTATAALTNAVTLPAPADTRNRSFAFSTHRQNEPTTPGSSGAKVATLIGSGGSMTPVAGKLHLAVVYMADGGGTPPLVTALTGNNLTWTEITRVIDTGAQSTVSVWQGVGASPTTGTPVITTNLGGGLSFQRSHFVDISNATGVGNAFVDIIQAGAGVTGKNFSMTYQQSTSGLFTAGLVALNTSAIMNPTGTTLISGSGGAQGVTDELSRFEVWKATFDDARPTTVGYTFGEASYLYGAVFLEILGGAAAGSGLAEGTDVTRTSPAAIGIETAHSVGVFQNAVAVSWATSSLGALMAVEVATGPPPSGVRLGATSNYISTFETMLGRAVDSQRVSVADTAALVTWGSGGWATAAAANTAGRAVFVSCFLGANTWAQVAAGNANAFLDTLGPNLAAFSQPGVFAYFPEPEDDTGTRGTSAQFRAAATFVINRLRPLMPGWRFANVLNEADWFSTSAFVGTPYFSANGRVASDWIVPEADILAVNAFNSKGAVQGTHPYADSTKATYADIPVATWASGWVASAAANAKYLMLSEFGCAVDDPAVNPNGHTNRAAWIGSAMGYLKGRAEAVHYADLDSVDGRINYRITGGVKTAEQDSVDAFESGSSAVSLTKSHTTTAIIRKAATRTHTTTAIVRRTLTRTQSADAVVRSPFTATHTTDAIIFKTSVTRTHTSDAYITPYVLVSHVTSSSSASVSSVTVS